MGKLHLLKCELAYGNFRVKLISAWVVKCWLIVMEAVSFVVMVGNDDDNVYMRLDGCKWWDVAEVMCSVMGCR